jgi:Ni,Fe-hydrogenase maturation factor
VPFENCARPEYIASLHGFDLSRLFFLASRESPLEAVIIGVEPARIAWDTELSSEIQAVVPHIIEAIKREIDT